jgi:nucleoside-diphosphate-sugar epimerase
MNVAVMGHNYIGKVVSQRLAAGPGLFVTRISPKINWTNLELDWDVIVNCASETKKEVVEQHYSAALLDEVYIFDRMLQIKRRNPNVRMIHISSICARSSDTSLFGDLKRQTESWAEMEFPNRCILRPGCLIGPGDEETVIHDWVNKQSLKVTSDSMFNFLSTEELGSILEHLILNWLPGETINVGASSSIRVSTILGIRDLSPTYRPSGELKKETYLIDTSRLQQFFSVKTSTKYVQEYLAYLDSLK